MSIKNRIFVLASDEFADECNRRANDWYDAKNQKLFRECKHCAVPAVAEYLANVAGFTLYESNATYPKKEQASGLNEESNDEYDKDQPGPISWKAAAAISEDYEEVLERETIHDLVVDEHGTIRWAECPAREKEIMNIFGATDLNDLFGRCRADKNDPLIRELYKCMGYSLYGYWEVFFWEMNNPRADEYDPLGVLNKK